jgi:hypothetical protein
VDVYAALQGQADSMADLVLSAAKGTSGCAVSDSSRIANSTEMWLYDVEEMSQPSVRQD